MTRKPILLTACLLWVGSSAWAHSERYVQDPYRASTVRALAHELEQATQHLYYQVADGRHHYGRIDSQVLRRLRKLESEASHFHRLVETRLQKAAHVSRDFRDLEKALYRVSGAVHGLPFGHAERDFQRVAYLIQELEFVLEGRIAVRRYDRLRVAPSHRYWWFQ